MKFVGVTSCPTGIAHTYMAAEALEQAAKDFPDKSARNIIVLITNGEESCGVDPSAVYARLQADGFIMKPYVVGFALKPQEVEKVRPGRRDRGQTWPDEHSKAGLRAAGRQGTRDRTRVRAGQDTYVDAGMGELPATLEVTVTYRGAVISNLCQLSVFAPGHGCTSEARPLASPLAFLGPSWGILTK
ncbi:MAG TPA: hypothetical protein PLQ23_00005, partial [Dermatophilaceae bacterium]|nr:hypothetical protein [Dermatophilaceae bacterium]